MTLLPFVLSLGVISVFWYGLFSFNFSFRWHHSAQEGPYTRLFSFNFSFRWHHGAQEGPYTRLFSFNFSFRWHHSAQEGPYTRLFSFSFSFRWHHSAQEGPYTRHPVSQQLSGWTGHSRPWKVNVGCFLSPLLFPLGDKCCDALACPCSGGSSSLGAPLPCQVVDQGPYAPQGSTSLLLKLSVTSKVSARTSYAWVGSWVHIRSSEDATLLEFTSPVDREYMRCRWKLH